MGKYMILILLMSEQVFATPPECPLFKNKNECLISVESNYNRYLDFINENTINDSTDEEDILEKDRLIQASLDIKKYESLACHKTCLN
jgi:hypothetical protein